MVAVGCLAERYGTELAESLPEADAVLGFDDYADVSERLQHILAGGQHQSHVPRDRRTLLPLAPTARRRAAPASPCRAVPGHDTAALPERGRAGQRTAAVYRRRLAAGPRRRSRSPRAATGDARSAPFRRSAVPTSPAPRPRSSTRRGGWPATAYARCSWSARTPRPTARTSATSGSLEKLLVDLAGIEELDWVRVSYLQPAEMRPSLVEVMAGTDKVVPYFDLSFQHAAPRCCAGCAGSVTRTRSWA